MVGTLQQIADYVRETFYSDYFDLSARRLDFDPGDSISYNTSAVNANTAFQVTESLKVTKVYTGFDFQSTTASAAFTFREDDAGFYAAQYLARRSTALRSAQQLAGGEAGTATAAFSSLFTRLRTDSALVLRPLQLLSRLRHRRCLCRLVVHHDHVMLHPVTSWSSGDIQQPSNVASS